LLNRDTGRADDAFGAAGWDDQLFHALFDHVGFAFHAGGQVGFVQ
jgi:hypothetical protein